MIGVRHLYISPGHNYFGHKGLPAGTNPIMKLPQIECVAGRGIRGDRFFDYKPDYKGQITFFSEEILDALGREFQLPRVDPASVRRNAITRGVDLNELIGVEFEIQGVRFLGVEECRPCYWMNQAVYPEAENWLKGRGGLRAKILNDGMLREDNEPC